MMQSTDDQIEEIVNILAEHDSTLPLCGAYEAIAGGETEFSEEDQEMQTAVFVVQQIYEAVADNEDYPIPQLLKIVGKRIRKAASDLSNLINASFITTPSNNSRRK